MNISPKIVFSGLLKMIFMKNYVISLIAIIGAAAFSQAQENNIPEPAESVKEEPVAVVIVENPPIYPGCEDKTSNRERNNCMSTNVSKHIGNHFDAKKMAEEGVPAGRHRVISRFTISKEGKITNINVRTDHEQLRAETIRVLELLPTMIPGKQRGRNVNVSLAVPIIIQVNELSKKDIKRLKREAKKKAKGNK